MTAPSAESQHPEAWLASTSQEIWLREGYLSVPPWSLKHCCTRSHSVCLTCRLLTILRRAAWGTCIGLLVSCTREIGLLYNVKISGSEESSSSTCFNIFGLSDINNLHLLSPIFICNWLPCISTMFSIIRILCSCSTSRGSESVTVDDKVICQRQNWSAVTDHHVGVCARLL